MMISASPTSAFTQDGGTSLAIEDASIDKRSMSRRLVKHSV